MSDRDPLPDWAELWQACQVAARDFLPALHALRGTYDGSAASLPWMHQGPIAETIGTLAASGAVRVAGRAMGGGLVLIPPNDPGFRLIRWTERGVVFGQVINSYGQQVGVVPPDSAWLLLVNMNDLVVALAGAMPPVRAAELPEGLSFTEDGTAVVAFAQALRIVERYRDVWDWALSSQRSSALAGRTLPPGPAVVLAALFDAGLGAPFSLYWRRGATWEVLPPTARAIMCADDGSPLGIAVADGVEPRPLGLHVRGLIGTLNGLRSEWAEVLKKREAERARVAERARRQAEQEEAQAIEATRRAAARDAMARAAEEQARARRVQVVESVAELLRPPATDAAPASSRRE
jgi:hypothetical protein